MCEIYFCDLTAEAQNRVLEHFHISNPAESNFDVLPLSILPDISDIYSSNASDDALPTSLNFYESKQQMREEEMRFSYSAADLPF